MNKKKNRLLRISSELHKEIAKILIFNLYDPRLSNITVSGITLSTDFNYAKVFITYLKEDLISIKNKLFLLNKSTGYIKKILRKKIKLRLIPNINFFYDNSMNIGCKISNLILQINNDQKLLENARK